MYSIPFRLLIEEAANRARGLIGEISLANHIDIVSGSISPDHKPTTTFQTYWQGQKDGSHRVYSLNCVMGGQVLTDFQI